MVTMVGTQADYTDALKALLELEFDALEAYKAAINRIKSTEYKQQLQQFQNDHERHINELKTILSHYTHDIPSGITVKSILTQGKVVIGGLVGDHSILRAMLTNEYDTNTAYERLNTYQDSMSEEKIFLKQAYKDEQKHKAWIEKVLDFASTR